jgi:hypothetical protein
LREDSESDYEYELEYDELDGKARGYVHRCWQCDKVHDQKLWKGSVALVGMLHLDDMILHSFQAWSTISVGLMAVDRNGKPLQRPPLHNDKVAFWPSGIARHGYVSGIAFFGRPHVLEHVRLLDSMSYPEGGGSCVACPCVNSFELELCSNIGGKRGQLLRVITVVVDGDPRRDQVARAGAMIDKHSPCVCLVLRLRGDMPEAIPRHIAEFTRSGADAALCHGSVGVVVGFAAVAAGSDTPHPELMDNTFKVKRWTCKRGEVDAAAIHFDFGGNPRGAARRRHR